MKSYQISGVQNHIIFYGGHWETKCGTGAGVRGGYDESAEVRGVCGEGTATQDVSRAGEGAAVRGAVSVSENVQDRGGAREGAAGRGVKGEGTVVRNVSPRPRRVARRWPMTGIWLTFCVMACLATRGTAMPTSPGHGATSPGGAASSRTSTQKIA